MQRMGLEVGPRMYVAAAISLASFTGASNELLLAQEDATAYGESSFVGDQGSTWSAAGLASNAATSGTLLGGMDALEQQQTLVSNAFQRRGAWEMWKLHAEKNGGVAAPDAVVTHAEAQLRSADEGARGAGAAALCAFTGGAGGLEARKQALRARGVDPLDPAAAHFLAAAGALPALVAALPLDDPAACATALCALRNLVAAKSVLAYEAFSRGAVEAANLCAMVHHRSAEVCAAAAGVLSNLLFYEEFTTFVEPFTVTLVAVANLHAPAKSTAEEALKRLGRSEQGVDKPRKVSASLAGVVSGAAEIERRRQIAPSVAVSTERWLRLAAQAPTWLRLKRALAVLAALPPGAPAARALEAEAAACRTLLAQLRTKILADATGGEADRDTRVMVLARANVVDGQRRRHMKLCPFSWGDKSVQHRVLPKTCECGYVDRCRDVASGLRFPTHRLESGGVQELVYTLVTEGRDEQVCRAACTALRNLCSADEEIARSATTALPALVEVLERHGGVEAVAVPACGTLAFVVFFPHMGPLCVARGGVEALVGAAARAPAARALAGMVLERLGRDLSGRPLAGTWLVEPRNRQPVSERFDNDKFKATFDLTGELLWAATKTTPASTFAFYHRLPPLLQSTPSIGTGR
jgi:hypothetical protein